MARVKGIGKLIKALDDGANDIEDDVDEILRSNSAEFSADTKAEAARVMTKGYWTGNLARLIEAKKKGGLQYAVISNAGYSGFLEYGTRFMEPETFMFQMYQKYDKQIKADIERLLNS